MKEKHDCLKPTHHPCRHCGGKTTKPVKKFMHRKVTTETPEDLTIFEKMEVEK